jgi:hypothetical protein
MIALGRCDAHRRTDTRLLAGSALITTLLLCFSALGPFIGPLIIFGWLAHLIVFFYCHALWALRRRIWESLYCRCLFTEALSDLTASISEPEFFQPLLERR